MLELPSGKEIRRFPLRSDFLSSLTILQNNRHLAMIGADNLVHLYDLQDGSPLFSLYLKGKADEWVAVSPSGYFEAPVAAQSDIHFRRERELIPLASFFETFFQPSMVARLMSGEALPPPSVLFDQVAAPPQVAIHLDSPQGKAVDGAVVVQGVAAIQLRLQAQSDTLPVEDIRLYHNEKLIRGSTRGLVVEEDTESDGKILEFRVPIELIPGENLFRAVAINSQRTESSPATLKIVRAAAEAAPASGGIRLHVLAVGVDTYQNPRYNLNYAVSDAKAFVAAIRQTNQNIYTAIEARLILNEQATRAELTQAFQSVAAAAGPMDTFVFFFAGHGVMAGDSQSTFYLAPHEVTQLYGDDAQMQRNGISGELLTDFSKNIAAQRQLFILDACQSAGALQSIAVRGAAEERAIAQLARSTGTHWIAASGSDQFAAEFELLGHGAFTYTLLKALSGGASASDGRITVNALKAYLESEVPELTRQHRGIPQYPASFGFGQDFPVAISQ